MSIDFAFGAGFDLQKSTGVTKTKDLVGHKVIVTAPGTNVVLAHGTVESISKSESDAHTSVLTIKPDAIVTTTTIQPPSVEIDGASAGAAGIRFVVGGASPPPPPGASGADSSI